MEFKHRKLDTEEIPPGHFQFTLSENEALELAGFLGQTKGGIEVMGDIFDAVEETLGGEEGMGIRNTEAYERGSQEFYRYHQYVDMILL